MRKRGQEQMFKVRGDLGLNNVSQVVNLYAQRGMNHVGFDLVVPEINKVLKSGPDVHIPQGFYNLAPPTFENAKNFRSIGSTSPYPLTWIMATSIRLAEKSTFRLNRPS